MADTKKKQKNALIEYFEDSYSEIRKVQWPTRNTAVRLTFLVLGFVFAVALFIGVLDFIFGAGYRALLEQAPDRALPPIQQPVTTEPVPVNTGTSGDELPGIEIGDIQLSEGTEGENGGIEISTESPEAAGEEPVVEESSS